MIGLRFRHTTMSDPSIGTDSTGCQALEMRDNSCFVSATLQPAIERRSSPPGLWWRWAVVLVPGVLLYFFTLPGMNTPQERLFAIFVATIVALVAQPVRMGVSVLLAMTVVVLTGTLTAARVLAGFGNVTVWLVFTAFLFLRAGAPTGFWPPVGYGL